MYLIHWGWFLMCLNGGKVFYFLNRSLGSPLIILCLNWGNLEMSLFFERKIFFFFFNCSWLNYTRFSGEAKTTHILAIRGALAFSFAPTVTNISFFLHSLHLPYLFIFSITLFFSLYKNLPLLFLFFTLSDSLILLFSKLFSFSPMVPRAKKSSYILSFDAFHLTH